MSCNNAMERFECNVSGVFSMTRTRDCHYEELQNHLKCHRTILLYTDNKIPNVWTEYVSKDPPVVWLENS